MKRIVELYRQLTQGTTPTAELVGKDNVVGRAVAPSKHGDVIVAEHVEGDVYDVAQIEPQQDSQSQQIQRSIQTPVQQTKTSRRVKGCRYKFQRTEIPELADSGTNASTRSIHTACDWRQNIEQQGQATSGETLQRAWEEWRARR